MPLALMNDIRANIPNDVPSSVTRKSNEVTTEKSMFFFRRLFLFSYQLACMRDA